jgi:hypothetical protein
LIAATACRTAAIVTGRSVIATLPPASHAG